MKAAKWPERNMAKYFYVLVFASSCKPKAAIRRTFIGRKTLYFGGAGPAHILPAGGFSRLRQHVGLVLSCQLISEMTALLQPRNGNTAEYFAKGMQLNA